MINKSGGEINFVIEKDYIFFLSSANKNAIKIKNNGKMLNEVEMETSNNNIYEQNNNNIYFVNYKTNKIVVIDNQYKVEKVWNIHNNGGIQVDTQNEKLYVCDTEEVGIYNLQNGEKLGTICGFSVANCIELYETREMIFILDIIEKELKTFDTSNLKLISKYKNLGASPFMFCIGKEAKYIYIANKGGLTERHKSYIYILDIIDGKHSKIDFEKGAILTSMKLGSKFLYVMNKGLGKIEVIDTLKRDKVSKLKTSFEKTKMFCLSPDKKILLVVSKDVNNKVALDVVDTDTNVKIDTFFPEFVDEKYLYISSIPKGKKQLATLEKKPDDDNKIFQIKDMKNYFEKMFVEFEKMRLIKIEIEKQLTWQKEKTNYYKKNNEMLKEQNNYYKKKLFQSDKDKIMIQGKLAEKTRIINNQLKYNKWGGISK